MTLRSSFLRCIFGNVLSAAIGAAGNHTTVAKNTENSGVFGPVGSLGDGSYLDISDRLAAEIFSEGKEPSRTALEALALEGYRIEQIFEAEIRRLLGFEIRMEA